MKLLVTSKRLLPGMKLGSKSQNPLAFACIATANFEPCALTIIEHYSTHLHTKQARMDACIHTWKHIHGVCVYVVCIMLHHFQP